MTFGNIYNRVMWILYGDTNHPQSTQNNMQGINYGIISEAHRKIQNDYNYWFMRKVYIKDIEKGASVIQLPNDYRHDFYVRVITYKDEVADSGGDATVLPSGIVSGVAYECKGWDYVIKVNNKWYWIVKGTTSTVEVFPVDDNTGSYEIRRVTGVNKIIKNQWFKNDGELAYFVKDGNLYLTKPISRDCLIELIYYAKFTPYEPFNDYTDAITENAADAIIYMAVEMEERRRREFQAATYYRQLADAEILRLRREHNSKMLANLTIPLED